MIEKFPPGTKVTHSAARVVGIVVARPDRMLALPDQTPVMVLGATYVVFWPTRDVREWTPQDDEPVKTYADYLRAKSAVR